MQQWALHGFKDFMLSRSVVCDTKLIVMQKDHFSCLRLSKYAERNNGSCPKSNVWFLLACKQWFFTSNDFGAIRPTLLCESFWEKRSENPIHVESVLNFPEQVWTSAQTCFKSRVCLKCIFINIYYFIYHFIYQFLGRSFKFCYLLTKAKFLVQFNTKLFTLLGELEWKEICCWMVNIQSSYLSNDRIKWNIRPYITSKILVFRPRATFRDHQIPSHQMVQFLQKLSKNDSRFERATVPKRKSWLSLQIYSICKVSLRVYLTSLIKKAPSTLDEPKPMYVQSGISSLDILVARSAWISTWIWDNRLPQLQSTERFRAVYKNNLGLNSFS